MSEEQKPRPANFEIPETEEEVPFDHKRKIVKKPSGRIKDVSEKDYRAFLLTIICIGLLSIFSFMDVCSQRDIISDSQMVESFFDIIKYVITTSLGFFFATTVAKKE